MGDYMPPEDMKIFRVSVEFYCKVPEANDAAMMLRHQLTSRDRDLEPLVEEATQEDYNNWLRERLIARRSDDAS